MNAKRLLLFFAFFIVIGIVITARSGGAASQLGQGYTGAPGDAGTCSSCHSGGAYGTVTPQIQIFQVGTTTPVTSYTAGAQYDMRVTVTSASGSPIRYGFQMTALRLSNNAALAGYSNLAGGIQQVPAAGRTYVEHNSASVSNQFNFRWTAPTSGTGSVRFYASGNCVNNNGGTSGDNAGTSFITITESIPLAVTGTKVDVTCFGLNNGSINITASGGAGGYTYLWSDGSTLDDRTGLAPGSYTVTVMDAAMASVTSSTFNITQPAAPLGITISVGSILCAGGTSSVIVGATGGTPAYTGQGTFNLAPGTYTRTVSDSKGCTKDTTFTIGPAPAPITVNAVANGLIPCSAGGTTVTVSASGGTGALTGTGTFTVLSPGNVTYTVTDVNGCSGQDVVTVSAVSGLSVTTSLTQPGCLDSCAGAIAANIQTNSTPTITSLVTQPGNQVVPNLTALCPGDYLYEVTDNAGCEFSFPFTINSPQPPTLVVTQVTSANGGNNGGINITVAGGIPPFNFDWSDNSIDEDLSNVGAGTYSVTVTDSNDCSATLSGLQIFDLAGIEEVSSNNLSVFPNPFNGEFQLSKIGYKVMSIKDMAGKKVQFIQTGQSVRMYQHTPGMYFIEVSSDKETVILKMMSE